MAKTLEKWLGWSVYACRFLHFVAMVATAIMALLVVTHVVMRYLLRAPLLFGEELAIILMIVVVFTVVPELFIRNQHLNVRILTDRFPIKVRHWVELVVTTVALLFTGVFTWYLTRLATIIYTQDTHYEVLRSVPKWPLYMLAPVSMAMVSIFMFIHLLKLLKPAKGKMTEGK